MDNVSAWGPFVCGQWSPGRYQPCSQPSHSTLSCYQRHCQGLQSCTAIHISLYDIHLLRNDGMEATTVTARDEGHMLVLEYSLHQCHRDNYGFHVLFIYSMSTVPKHHSSFIKGYNYAPHVFIAYIQLPTLLM